MNLFKNTISNRLAYALLTILSCNYAIAQKTPAIQNTGYFAPQNIKIDGKADDWSNQFQANNKHNHVEYTIANNDSYLYFILQTADKQTINKIGSHGLSLIISPAKKQVNNALTITFPQRSAMGSGYLLGYTKADATDKQGRQLFFDSLMNLANQKIEASFKFIGVTGTSLLPDSSISVYNLDGIKAAARMDNKLVFTYELAVPLKYLKDHLATDKFSYDIKFNGVDAQQQLQIIHREGNPKGDVVLFQSGGVNYMIGTTNNPDTQFYAYSTDFWGEYNIVTK